MQQQCRHRPHRVFHREYILRALTVVAVGAVTLPVRIAEWPRVRSAQPCVEAVTVVEVPVWWVRNLTRAVVVDK